MAAGDYPQDTTSPQQALGLPGPTLASPHKRGLALHPRQLEPHQRNPQGGFWIQEDVSLSGTVRELKAILVAKLI